MGLKVDFEIEDHVIVLIVMSCVLGIVTGAFDWVPAYLRNRESILAIHGTLIAGLIAIVAAKMTVTAMNRQIAHEKFTKAMDDYNKAYGKTKTVSDQVHSYLLWFEGMVSDFENGYQDEKYASVEKNLIDRPDVPAVFEDPYFVFDLSPWDADIIKRLRDEVEAFHDKSRFGISYYRADGRMPVSSIRLEDLISLKKTVAFYKGRCRALLEQLSCHQPEPQEDDFTKGRKRKNRPVPNWRAA